MRNQIKSLLISTLTTAFVLVAATAMAVDLTENDKAKLLADKSIRKPLPNSGNNGFYGGTGYTIIDAPVEVVWAAARDWSSYHKIFPKTVSVKEVSRKGHNSLLKMKMGHKLISIDYFVSVKVNPDKRIISFKLVRNKPHDIEESRGYWRLFPQKDGRTLVAYVVAAQIPMGIINLIKPELVAKIQRNLIGAPKALKKWINKHKERYKK